MTVFGAGVKTWQNRAGHLNYRARRSGVEGTVSATQLIEIVRQHGARCFHCQRTLSYEATGGGHPLSRKYGSFDHLTPLSRGGAHLPFNVVPSCRGCNNRRGCQPFLVQMEAA